MPGTRLPRRAWVASSRLARLRGRREAGPLGVPGPRLTRRHAEDQTGSRPSGRAPSKRRRESNGPHREGRMGILSWILLGLVVGVLAKWIMPGPDPGGMVITILLGVAGAFVGGFLGSS